MSVPKPGATKRFIALIAVVVAFFALPALAGAAEFPQPTQSDTYSLQSTMTALPQAGSDMGIDDLVYDQNGYLWTLENDWMVSHWGMPGYSRLVKRTAAGQPIAVYGQGLGGQSVWYGLSVTVEPATGLLYVTDGFLGQVSIFNPNNGSYLGALGEAYLDDLTAIDENPYGMSMPTDVAFDSSGSVYVSDQAHHRVVKFNQSHEFLYALGVVAYPDGSTAPDGFAYPHGIHVDNQNNLYVADTDNNRIQKFSPTGALLTPLHPKVNGTDVFTQPWDVDIDDYGTIYVLDRPAAAPFYGGRFSRWGAQYDALGQYGGGLPTSQRFYQPSGISVDNWGTIRITNKVGSGKLGNFGTWLLNAGTPDTVPPTTSSDAPTAWSRGPLSVRLQAVDTSSPVVATYYSADESTPAITYAAGTFLNLSNEGTTTLKYYSIDRPGNVEQVVTQHVHIDNTAPESTSDVVPLYFGQAALDFSATDALSGVRDIWWSIDGSVASNKDQAIIVDAGLHTLTYYAEDNAGNLETPHITTFLLRPPDSDPPTTYWSEYRPDWFLSNPTITLVATDSVSGVRETMYRVDAGAETTYTEPFTWTQEGTHTIEYWSVDNLSHAETPHLEQLRLDRTKPVSSADVPQGIIGTATVTFSAIDAVSGVARQEWRLDTEQNWTQGNTATVYVGSHTLWYRAIDRAGNAEDAKSVNIVVLQPDYAPPVTDTNIPPTGWVKGPFHLQLDASDDISGVRESRASVDGAPFVLWSPNAITVTDGIHEVSWYSVDNRGNRETTKTATLKVDSVPPTTTDDHQPFYSGPSVINLTALNSLAPAQSFYRIDGGTVLSGQSISLNDYRVYNIEYWSVDDAGNEELPHHNISVTVAPPDSDPPITSFTGPSGWQKGSAQFSLTAFDASSTVRSTWYSLDGGNNYYSYYAPVTVTQEGTTTIPFYSLDLFNNREANKFGTVMVDGSAPITGSDAVDSYTEQAVITLAPADPYSGVDKTFYRVNGGTWQQGTVATVPWNRWRKDHRLDWYSIDKVGNVEPVKTAAFEVRLTSKTEQEDNEDIVYRGAWDFAANPNNARTNDASGYALIAFQGTRLDLYTYENDFYGKARVSLLDTDVPAATIDLYNNNSQSGELKWTTGDLEFGDYLIKIERIGEKNPASSGYAINLDYVRVEGSVVPVPDNEAPSTTVSAPSGWQRGPVSVSLSSADTTTGVRAIYSSSTGAQASALSTYTGPISINAEGVTTVSYYAMDNRGNTETERNVTVRVDNSAPLTNSTAQPSYNATASIALLPSDAYSGVAYTRYRIDGGVWTTGTAVTAPYSVGYHKLEWYSVDNVDRTETTRSADYYMSARNEQNDPRITYRGSWATTSNASHSGGTHVRSSGPAPAAAHITFRGTGIDLLAMKSNSFGIANVSLDGGAPIQVDLYSLSNQYRSMVWSVQGLTDTTHTVSVSYSGLKNAASTGTSINLDAVDVVGGLIGDTMPPVSTASPTGAWRATPETITIDVVEPNTWVATTLYRLNGGSFTAYTGPFVVSDEGATLIEYYSVDGAGNTEPLRASTVRIDRVAPVVEDDAPAEWVNGTPIITLTATDGGANGASILYSVDGSEPSLPYSGPIAISAEGTLTLKYRAYDQVGNGSEIATKTVRVDNTAPMSSDTAPSGWVGGPVDVVLSSFDALSGLTGIEYRLNGGPWKSYTDPIRLTEQGATSVEYRATDAAHNTEDVQTSIVTIDDDAPVVSDDAPSGWVDGPVLVELTAHDSVSGVSSILYSLDGSTPSLPYSGPIAVWAQGTTPLKYSASDSKGNESAVVTREVMIDDISPVTADDAPIAWTQGPVTVSLEAMDTVSGVRHILYSTDGTAPSLVAEGDVVHISAEGTTTLRYAGVDLKGNVESPRTATIRIDNTAPTTTSDAASSYNETASVSFTAQDDLSSVVRTRYRVDGGDWVDGSAAAITAGGTHVVEWFSVDAAGNAEEIRTATFDVVRRFEQTHQTISFAGIWTEAPDSRLSAGTHARGTASGSRASFSFAGTGFDLIALKSAGYGIAKVTVDGSVNYVDLYASTPLFKSVAWRVRGLPDGIHSVTLEWTGTKNPAATGNVVGIDAIDVVGALMADTEPPTTTSNADPAWRSTPATITLTATDALSPVSSIRYRVNGGTLNTYGAPFGLSAEGVNTIEYYAADAAGNVEETRTATVKIDYKAPNITSDSSSAWTSATVTVRLTATDAGVGVGAVTYSIDGSDPTTPYLPNGIAVSTEGTTTVKYRAADLLGNTTTVRTSTVRIDQSAPVSTDDAPTQWVKGPATLNLTSNDGRSGVARIDYRLDQGPWTTFGTPISIGAEGVHTIEYFATDNVGLSEAPRSATLKVDNTSPVTSSNAAPSYTGNASVVLSASDAHSGVASTQYRLDGGDWTTGTIVSTGDIGEHTIQWRSTDLVGNLEEPKSATFSVYRRYEQDTAQIYYRGAWTESADSRLSGGTHLKTTTAGSLAAFAFEGTAFDLYALKSSGYGIARVTVDGGAPTLVDLYAATPTFKAKVFGVQGLSAGVHTVCVEFTGTKNAAASTTAIGLDAIDIIGVTVADDETPTTTSNTDGGWRATPAMVTLTSADTLSAVSATRYRVNGGALNTYTTPFTISAEGISTIEFYSIDLAGNAEETRTATVRTDYRAPTLNIDASSAWTRGPVAVHIDCTDAGAGVASVTYSTDGSEPTLPYPPEGLAVSAEGTTTIKYRASDVLGNTTSIRTATVRVDDTAPVSTDDAPVGWVSGPVQVTLTSQDSLAGVTGVRWSVDGSTATTYSAPIEVSAEGATSIEYAAVDAAGNTESTRTATVLLDRTAPSISDDAPGSWVSGPVLVSLDATDEHSGVAQVLYSTDGSAPHVPYVGPIMVTAEGSTAVKYEAIDVRGNSSGVRTATVLIDDAAPATTHDAPSGWSTLPLTVHLSATDLTSGVDRVLYSIDGGQPSLVATDGAVTFSAEGTYQLKFSAVDAKGNTEAVQSTTVRVDGTTPVTTSDAVPNYQTGSATITLAAVDNLSGVAGTSYKLDAGAWTTGTVVQTTVGGAHTLLWRSTDVAGNVEATKSVGFSLGKRYEQNDAAVYYKGTWTESLDSRLSAGSHLRASATGSIASFAFRGTGFDLFSLKSSGYGIARVSVDGGTPANVDLYAPTATFQSRVFSAQGLPNTLHTVRIEYTGTKNVAASSAVIGIDAIEVLGEIVVDDAAPMTTTDANGSWRATAALVSLTPTDSLNPIAYTRYRLNGGTLSTYTAPFNVSAEGVTSIEYFSSDIAGNIENTKTAMVRIDYKAPIVSADTTNSAWSQGPVTVRIDASDTGSGLGSVVYSLDGTEPSIPYQSSNGIVVSAEGTTTVKYRATDAVGNTSAVKATTIRIDNTSPVTTHSAPTGWVNGPAQIALSSTDGHSGSPTIRYSIAGGALTTYTGPFQVAIDGTTTVEYAATDAVGNAETTKTVTVMVDRVAPITTSNVVQSYDTTANISFTAADVLSGVASTAYRVNGSAWVAGASYVTTAGGTHTLEWRTTDVAGNVEQSSVATFSVTKHFEQDASSIWLRGAWGSVPDPRLSGGTHVRATAPGHAANIAFKGTALEWIGVKSTGYGIARVTVDTRTPEMVDLYASPLPLFKSKIWGVSGLSPDTTHTVRIEWTGSKNTSATSNALSLDALNVVGELVAYPAVRTEESSGKIGYSAGWSSAPDVRLSSGAHLKADTFNSAARVSFNGTSIDWLGVKSTGYGIARVTVDTRTPEMVDMYAATPAFRTKVWGANNLPDGAHNVLIEWTGSKNASASASALSIDAFDIRGELTTATAPVPAMTRTEESSTKIAYAGAWTDASESHLSGGAFRKTTETGAGVAVTFSGTAIDWVGLKSSAYGIAKVTLDGGTPEYVDMYSANAQWMAKVWSKSGLTNTTHTVIIECTGTKNAASAGYSIDLDAVDINGTLTQATPPASPLTRFDDADDRLAWAGEWETFESPALHNGAHMRASTSGAAVNIAFTGVAVDWIGVKSASYGIAKVTLDDGAPEYVDLYSATAVFKSRIWTKSGLANGTHVLKIEVTGDKNAASAGTLISVDAVDVNGALTEAAPPVPASSHFEQTDSRLAYEGVWERVQHPSLSGGSHDRASETGARVVVDFTGTAVDWFALKSSGYGIAKVTLDGGPTTYVDLYSPTAVWKSKVFSASGLTAGTHRLVIECTGMKNEAASATTIGVDAFDIAGSL